MIADLNRGAQAIVVQLFSPTSMFSTTYAPKVADALGRVQVKYAKPVVDIEERNREYDKRPAVVF